MIGDARFPSLTMDAFAANAMSAEMAACCVCAIV
jgi:hypothetical protein